MAKNKKLEATLHKHVAKEVAHKPGLITIKCRECRKIAVREYETPQELETIRRALRLIKLH